MTKTIKTDMLTKKEMKEYVQGLEYKADYWVVVWAVGQFPHQRQIMSQGHCIYIQHPKKLCVSKFLNKHGYQNYRFTLTHHPQKGQPDTAKCRWCYGNPAEQDIKWHLKYPDGKWTKEIYRLCTYCRKLIGNQKKRVQ